MKSLVIFYSLQGNTKLMAESIAGAVNADILELKQKKVISKKGFMKYFWGAKAIMMKETPELIPVEKNFQDYDLLFIGTPVWASTYAPALNSYFKTNDIQDKKVALFCCHQGMKGNIFKKIKGVIPGNEIVSEIDFLDPAKVHRDQSVEEIKVWARSLV